MSPLPSPCACWLPRKPTASAPHRGLSPSGSVAESPQPSTETKLKGGEMKEER